MTARNLAIILALIDSSQSGVALVARVKEAAPSARRNPRGCVFPLDPAIGPSCQHPSLTHIALALKASRHACLITGAGRPLAGPAALLAAEVSCLFSSSQRGSCLQKPPHSFRVKMSKPLDRSSSLGAARAAPEQSDFPTRPTTNPPFFLHLMCCK